MANRLKEDEKHERLIRGLLKLQENRRCINCNSLGPQYVCTNFWTFICTTCSGIHREFTHRVKSVSMAKFTSQEVSALQKGGNQCAKEVLLKEWDPQCQSFPDSSNIEKLRNFIKHVYVDRRYTGERNYEKPPKVKMGDKEDVYDNRRDTYQGGSRSPPYEDTYERRYNEQSSPGGRSDENNSRYDERRSPGHEESRQYGGYRRSSPARPEVINDWRRDDRFGNGRKYEESRIYGDLKLESRSPERPRDLGSSSPPMIRPVREILGDNVLPLRISEPPKANGVRVADGSTHSQRTVSSSSLGSTMENQGEVKLEATVSLIDFDADPEPFPAASTEAQRTVVAQSVAQPASSTNNNWASFDFAPEVKVSQGSSNLITLESVFSQLSVPGPGQVSGIPSGAGAPVIAPATNVNPLPGGANLPVASMGQAPFSVFNAAPAAPQASGFATFPSANVPVPAPRVTRVMSLPVNAGNSLGMQHQRPSLFPTPGDQFTASHFTPSVDGASHNQPWNSSLVQNPQRPAAAQPLQSVPKPNLESTCGGVAQPSPEVNSMGRKPLPEDLFTAAHSSFPASAPGWQTLPPYGMGYAVQYNTAAPMSNFVQSNSKTNPFDVNNDSPSVQAQTFPSMASLQGVLPNGLHPGLLRTSSLGSPSPAGIATQASAYSSAMPSQMPSYSPATPSNVPTHESAIPPRPYMGTHVHSHMPASGHQEKEGLGSEGATFGFMNPDSQLAGTFSAPATAKPFASTGGNPFG